jgi:hypothetical protein
MNPFYKNRITKNLRKYSFLAFAAEIYLILMRRNRSRFKCLRCIIERQKVFEISWYPPAMK